MIHRTNGQVDGAIKAQYAIITSMIADYAAERGLTVTFKETCVLGVTVCCDEAEGLWLQSLEMTCDGEIGAFEVGYQHMAGQLKTIRDRMLEVVDLLTTYQKLSYDALAKELDSAAKIFAY